ncbi:hypothetical protein EOD42_13820 [Rhodovarius crocodyli]|uniref:DUF3592 domain-containing protein n=1 Tax=Rhodovarius crocodyli TaxID=1979269 RepID=A0A437MEV3_9PROT|nr:hypothetical protein [Rhodovarius crocodyli]RVT96191.1 hypothetical protein EOD42_13820 [Rhodovarius crocodyli]
MEYLGIAGGCLVAGALTLLRLLQMSRWIRRDAVHLGVPSLWAVSGQAVQVRYLLDDGRPVIASLRHYGRGGPPAKGATARIIQHPEDPERIEWAMARPILAAILAVLAFVMVKALMGWWSGG